ncbi:MAG TPA: DPP IV N-terminal domain-containing protein, partial [Pirellulales bacterium]
MHRIKQALLLWATGLALSNSAWAQGSRADYQRAAQLRRNVENTVFRDRVQPNWLPGGNRFWYRVRTGRDRHEFVLVDAEHGWRGPLFDHVRLAAVLSRNLKREVAADALPLERVEPDEQAQSLVFAVAGRRFRCDLRSYEIEETSAAANDASLPVRDRAPRRSRTSDEETEIVFVNQTTGDLSVFWRDYEGGRRPYGTLKPGAERRQHTFSGHVWEAVDAEGGVLALFVASLDARRALIPSDAKPLPPRDRTPAAAPGTVSPDGRWSAEVRSHNLWLRRLDSPDDAPSEFALTTDGSAEDAYQPPLVWSPDSAKLLTLQTRPAQEHTVYLVESSPADQLQPKLHTLNYLKPGDVIARPRPRLFDIAERRAIPISDELFANPWSIDQLRWDADSRRFTFLYNQRGHQTLRVIAVDAESGAASALIEETSPTLI